MFDPSPSGRRSSSALLALCANLPQRAFPGRLDVALYTFEASVRFHFSFALVFRCDRAFPNGAARPLRVPTALHVPIDGSGAPAARTFPARLAPGHSWRG